MTVHVVSNDSEMTTALAALSTDDEIWMRAGTYSVDVYSFVSGVTFRAHPDDMPDLDARTWTVVQNHWLHIWANWTVIGIHITDRVIYDDNNGATNVTIKGCKVAAPSGHAPVRGLKDGSVVQQCWISGGTGVGISAVAGQDDITIDRVIVSGCTDIGINVNAGLVEHSIVYDCAGVRGIRGGTVRNSIVANGSHTTDGIYASVAHDSNNVWSHGSGPAYAGASQDAGSLEVDPLFTDPAGGDFSIPVGSPMGGAGSTSAASTGDITEAL